MGIIYPELIKIIIAFLTGGGFVAVLQIIRWYAEFKRPFLKKELVDVSKIYESLQLCRSKTGANRVSLVKLHNGGGRPRAGHPMYSSVVYEVYDDIKNSLSKDWQNERIDNDNQYREMLIKMFDSEINTNREITENIPESKLRNMYVPAGVKRNILKCIGEKTDKQEYYYICAVFNHEDQNFEQENNAMRVCSQEIKSILGCI